LAQAAHFDAMKTSNRSDIPPFYAMEVMKAANDREAAGKSVLHMEVGEPGAGPPRKVLKAAADALGGGNLGYTEALGIPDLRAAIAKHYGDRYGIELPAGRIVVTTGSSGGFMLALLAAFDPGDRLAVGVPYYPAYRNMMTAFGIEPVFVAVGARTRFQPTPEALAAAGPLDGVLVASPANPTGTMLSAEAMAALVAYCADAGLRLLSDEIYHGITYGERPSSALAHGDAAIVFNGFSKYFCMTGWRLGWMVVPEDLSAAVERLAQNLFISAPNISQRSAITAFDCHDELEGNVAGYARSRKLLLRELPKAGIDQFAPADGAFYLYANVSNLTNDSADFCRRMLDETGVAVTPGIDFDAERGAATVRISFAGAEADMAEAAARLIDWLG
jgi:aspartate/methionine/tyrosine aminotransferase